MTPAWTHPVEFVRVIASLMPRELEATTTVAGRMSDAQLDALSREVFKAALILQRRMSFSRSARLYSVEPAPHFLPFNEAHKKRDNYADPWIDACSGRSA